MSISVTLHTTNEGPQVFVQQTNRDNEKFQQFAHILKTGPTCLGHSRLSNDGHTFHVWKIRTHWVGDDGGYSLIGNGDQQLSKLIEAGWGVTDYRDIYNETNDTSKTQVSLSKGTQTKTIELNTGDRHAPIVDGIYTTIFLAQKIFGQGSLDFSITKEAKELIGSEGSNPE